MNRTKRLLGIGGILVLILVLLVMTASAETKIVDEGQWGNQIYWTLDDQGTLLISGSGTMNSFTITSTSAWRNYRDNITNIVIEEGVTSISHYAFDRCKNLVSVKIPSSVTYVGIRAFSSCSQLVSVVIPDSVKTICGEAFLSCSNLQSIVLPTNLTYIGDLFHGCSSLTTISIPNNVVEISDDAFRNCSSLKDIYIPNGVVTIKTDDDGKGPFFGCSKTLKIWMEATKRESGWEGGWDCTDTSSSKNANVIYSAKYSDFIYWSAAKSTGIEFVIPNGITMIPNKSISPDIQIISIPTTVKKIENEAFYGLGSFVVICSSSSYARSWCISNGIPVCTTSTYGMSGTQYWVLDDSGTLFIGGDGEMTEFSKASILEWRNYTDKIKKAVIDEGVTSIGKYAFYNCNHLTSVIIPQTITSIDSYAFVGCTSLPTLTLGDNIERVMQNAFDVYDGINVYCYKDTMTENALKENGIAYALNTTMIISGKCGTDLNWSLVNYHKEGNDYTLVIEGTGAMNDYNLDAPWYSYRSEICSLELHEGITYIGNHAFDYCTKISNPITIPDTVIAIGEYAFYKCGIPSVSMNNQVERIGRSAFSWCERLTLVKLSDQLQRLEDSVLNATSITDITLPSALKYIGAYALNTRKTGSQYTLSTITVSCDIETESTSFGPTMVTDLHHEVIDKAIEPNCMETGLTEGSHCEKCGKVILAQEIIPASGHKIAIDGVSVATGTMDGSIGRGYCCYCQETLIEARAISADAVLVLPNNITHIDQEALMNTNAQQIVIPSGATSIGSKAFADNKVIMLIVIPDSVSYIAPDSLDGCNNVVILCNNDSYAADWAATNNMLFVTHH